MNTAMKRSLSLAVLGQGAIELFFYLPVLLIAAVYVLPASAVWLWIGTLPICYWAASVPARLFPKLRRIERLLISLALGAAHAFVLFGFRLGELSILPLAVCSVAGTLIAVRGMSVVLRGWSVSFPNSQLLIGVTTYLAVQPLKLFLFKKIADYNSVLIICGIAAVLLFFFIANERHLNSETVDTAQTPATLAFKRQNRFLMLIVVSIIAILALFRQIQQAIERLFLTVIEKVMSWFNRPQEQEPAPETAVPQTPPDMGGAEAKPPSDWMILLEQMLKMIGITLIIAAVSILLFFILRKLYRWAKVLVAKLLERGAENRKSDADFTDEVEHLMSSFNLRKQMGDQLKKLLPKKRVQGAVWEDFATNAEKIRFLYTYLVRAELKRGRSFQAHLTPRETAELLTGWKSGGQRQEGLNDFIAAYEKVRYGEKNINDAQLEALKQQLYQEKK
ncbi:DUF4129 domain-containing protein [Paenibacillus alkaliterrae]|uniref:DUF4129 domain-containing protein n=1 Tax=Paenibacillus alkaliterrae TaxID=320909 RepID=UPI001F2384B9|nr:DUF4129 domain-containing protein [Paenibacillus alkaliterrae]MCF2938250.1 DUF4129 domain-containing protein [Paenibacillus alkaliterrae]